MHFKTNGTCVLREIQLFQLFPIDVIELAKPSISFH